MSNLWKALLLGGILGISALFFFGLDNNPRAIPSPLKGAKAPSFEAPTLDGKVFSSQELQGKVSLVTFWATWCTTCKSDEPLVEALQKRFGGNADFRVVGIVTQDELSAAQEYVKRSKRNYVNLYDEKGRLAIDFGVYGVPESYLIDRDGTVIEKIAGPINYTRLSKQVEKLLTGASEG